VERKDMHISRLRIHSRWLRRWRFFISIWCDRYK